MKKPFSFLNGRWRARVPQSLMLIPLAPVLVVQAWRTVRRTPRLDPASGDEHGFVPGANPGSGPAFRVVVIGESTAAGVGASQHAQALPGFLAEALKERLRRSVAWSVTGENGATARRVTTGLVPAAGGPPALDLVVVTVGINDLIRRRPLRRWTADLADLIAVLRGRYADATLVVAGMPPVHRFPAIPQPLRLVLGARARSMDRIMRDVAVAGGAVHAPMDEGMARDRRLFASDGFHPSPAGYRAWAEDLARAAAPTAHPFAALPSGSPSGSPSGTRSGSPSSSQPSDHASDSADSAPPADTVPPQTMN
ncbi:SGNH/GDSL hydrolase family protein [Actinomadura soli]|uniref:SGNH/GDSL hydrolase family protein n=1 Tax=Actinomadura soli TaxID=2508997 RepID=A0A5C4JE20_9ACTN|nr:SGNH/GDSL hydrolase family protein [Actinomadura soli]TMR00632.1 SGNH/GDSL hydrolase family protein [Actinomadura soli]